MITASLVETATNEAGAVGDVYFYYSVNKSKPSSGNMLVDIRSRQADLCKIVAGSGSIYPFFPSIPLYRVGDLGNISLIDGGFSHNSPIHAAAVWDASHVIVVEASPVKKSSSIGFGSNLVDMFNFMHDQAQTLDVLARDELVVFSIRPHSESGRIGLVDFVPGVINAAIEEGRRDARAGMISERNGGLPIPSSPRFQKRLGNPVLNEL